MIFSYTQNLYTVNAVIVLDGDGKRIISKYYNLFPTLAEQQNFESLLFRKSKKSSSDIIMLEGHVVVYRNNLDLFFYFVGSTEDNELCLHATLNGFFNALHTVLK